MNKEAWITEAENLLKPYAGVQSRSIAEGLYDTYDGESGLYTPSEAVEEDMGNWGS